MSNPLPNLHKTCTFKYQIIASSSNRNTIHLHNFLLFYFSYCHQLINALQLLKAIYNMKLYPYTNDVSLTSPLPPIKGEQHAFITPPCKIVFGFRGWKGKLVKHFTENLKIQHHLSLVHHFRRIQRQVSLKVFVSSNLVIW